MNAMITNLNYIAAVLSLFSSFQFFIVIVTPFHSEMTSNWLVTFNYVYLFQKY